MAIKLIAAADSTRVLPLFKAQTAALQLIKCTRRCSTDSRAPLMRHEPDRAFQNGDRKQFLQRAASRSIENDRRGKFIVLRSSGYFRFHYIFLSLKEISQFGQNMEEVFLLAFQFCLKRLLQILFVF